MPFGNEAEYFVECVVVVQKSFLLTVLLDFWHRVFLELLWIFFGVDFVILSIVIRIKIIVAHIVAFKIPLSAVVVIRVILPFIRVVGIELFLSVVFAVIGIAVFVLEISVGVDVFVLHGGIVGHSFRRSVLRYVAILICFVGQCFIQCG